MKATEEFWKLQAELLAMLLAEARREDGPAWVQRPADNAFRGVEYVSFVENQRVSYVIAEYYQDAKQKIELRVCLDGAPVVTVRPNPLLERKHFETLLEVARQNRATKLDVLRWACREMGKHKDWQAMELK